jgi:hypothetical protein
MDKADVAVGLATIGIVGAAFLFSVEHARNGPISFIERRLGLSPGGSDGSMEIIISLVLVAIVVAVAFRLATK